MLSKSLHPGKQLCHGSARDSVLCPVLEVYNRNMQAGFLS